MEDAREKKLAERFNQVLALWRRVAELEEIVESHEHDYFESCSVCGERGEYAAANARYRQVAQYYVDELCSLTDKKATPGEAEYLEVPA